VPYLGGQFFLFFKPVFNVADMAITTGVIQIILFQRQFFQKPEDVESQVEKETETEDLPPATPAEDTQQEQG
jgi:signal peptidase II